MNYRTGLVRLIDPNIFAKKSMFQWSNALDPL
jgi:hypothetical protein